MKNTALDPQFRTSGTLDVRIMARAGDRVKLAVASSPDAPLPADGHRHGYYMFSEGKRWFVSWLTNSAPIRSDSPVLLAAMGCHEGVGSAEN